MRTLEEWSLDELWHAHEVLDALERVDQRSHADAERKAREK